MTNTLLQSEQWEQFQRALGRETWRVDGVLAIRMPLPFGLRYLSSPRSDAATSRQPQASSDWCRSLQQYLDETRAVFFRTDATPDQRAACSVQLRAPAVMRRLVEPEWTWRTSLDGSDDERMAAMHEKHRYNVRLAERRGVRVSQYSSESVNQGPIVAFWSLLQDTARRQGIATHPKRYYETMLRTLVRPPTPDLRLHDTDCKLYMAEHDGVPLAAAVIAYYSDGATYLHGGSSHAHRSLMAPHLLHWTAMRDAKAAGLRWYDFGGVAAPGATVQVQGSHAHWSGMTRFKTGFGGEAVHHPPTMDLVLRPGWYRLLSWMARLRA